MSSDGQSDRNLLLGMLALQMDFLSRDALIAGMNEWVLEKARGLGPILVDRGALTSVRLELLESMVREHLSAHGGKAEQSLTSLGPPLDLIDALKVISDPDIESTIGRLSDASISTEHDPQATRALIPPTNCESRYRVLRPHARGGIGTVSIALDTELHREVALKEIQTEHADEPQSRARFLIEAEVTGRLEHPGIVPVYGLGTGADGRPYYAMRFVKGESLKEAIRAYHQNGTGAGARGMEFRKLLTRFLDVCNAVAFAHSRGVIHRDIKPANILMGPYGETLLVDWGLAKVIGRPEPMAAGDVTLRPQLSSGSGETLPGSAIGTPSYMSPEQAEGKLDQMGPASDVYSLGATLYSLLTGKMPVEDKDVASVLQRVIQGDIPAPRQVDSRVDPAIEAICLKAMARKPDDRYPSARALFEELERWMADEPVSAFRDPLSTRLTRWGRRRKTAAVGLGVLLLTASAALGVLNLAIQREQKATAEQRDIARERSLEAARSAQTLERQLYFNRVNLAQREWALNNVALAEELLSQCPESLRGWEWSYCKWLCHMDRLTIKVPADNPAAAEWSLRGVHGLAFSPDGRQVASGGADFAVTIWSTTTGKEVRSLQGHTDVVLAVAYSPDGRTIATGSKDLTIKIWDAETGQLQDTFKGTKTWIWSLAFSPDGKRLVGVSSAFPGAKVRTPEVRIWEVATGHLLHESIAPSAGYRSVAWSRDGKRIGAAGSTVEILDATTGQALLSLKGHADGAYGVAFSRDGRWFATAGLDRQVILWDTRTGQQVRSMRGHSSRVVSVAFDPGSRIIATGSSDNTVRLWDVETGLELATVRGHTKAVTAVCFSDDGAQLASASEDGTVKLWETSTVVEGESRSLTGHRGWAYRVAYTPDGHRLASSGWGVVKIWDSASGRELRLIETGQHAGVSGLAMSPDGRTIAISRNGSLGIDLWELSTGKPITTLSGQESAISAIAFRPTGAQLAASCTDGKIRIWDVDSRREIRTLGDHPGGAFGVIYNPKGTMLASIGWDSKVRLWDADDGHLLKTLTGIVQIRSDRSGNALAFSPDGRQLAAASDDGVAVVWDLESGEKRLTLRGHTEQVNSVAYLDARRIVTSAEDSTIRLWDAETGENVFTLRGHTNGVLGLVCRPDGQQIASASIDESVRLWDVSAPTPEASRMRRLETLRQDAERAVGENRWPEALSGLNVLVEAEPESTTLLALRALAHNGLGRTSEALSDLERAGELGLTQSDVWKTVLEKITDSKQLDQAEAILSRILKRELESKKTVPTAPAHELDALGSARQRLNDPEGAIRAFAMAIDAFESHYRILPDRGGIGRVWVPHLHEVIASLQSHLGRSGEAIRKYDQAVVELVDLHRRFPEDTLLRERLVRCLRALVHPRYHTEPAVALSHLRQVSALIEEMTAPSPVDLHYLAGSYALSSSLIGRDHPEPTPAETAERESLAGRAINALRRSIAAGYRNVRHLRECPDLAPISNRPEFQDIVNDLAFPANPFAGASRASS